jgi:hypothetical protein
MLTAKEKSGNPFMICMRKKIKAPLQHKHAKNLAQADRKAAAQNRALRNAAIWEDIQNYWKTQGQIVKDLARKHNKDKKWMRQAVICGPKYGQQRRISPFNAWTHAQSLVINEGMNEICAIKIHSDLFMSTDLPPGEKAWLQDLQKATYNAASYKDVSESDIADMIQCLEEKRLRERKGLRSHPQAHLWDVQATSARIQAEVSMRVLLLIWDTDCG